MKHLLGISLFLVLVAPFFVPYTLLRYEKNQIRKSIKRQLIKGVEESELIVFRFSKQETQTVIHWEHSKEFEYKNEMYDVVETRVSGDSIVYLCWWDHEETTLNKRLSSCLEDALGKDAGQKKKEKEISSFFELLYYPSTFYWQSKHILLDNKHSVFFIMQKCVIYFSPNVPPPKPIV